MSLKDRLIDLLWYSGLTELGRMMLTRNGRFVLMFHGVSAQKYTGVPREVQPFLTRNDLETVLSWLRQRHVLLTSKEFLGGDKPGVLLTFDDGLANNHANALPVLQKFEAPAVFFVTLQHILDPRDLLPGSRELARMGWGREQAVPKTIAVDIYDGMSVEQLRSCARHPLITIGSHTISHPFLTRCGAEELDREIAGSKRMLEEIINKRVDLFAYPTGDYNREVIQAVKKAGYQAAFAVEDINEKDSRYEIPRIGLYASTPSYLGLKLSGLYHRPLRTGSAHG